MAPSLSRGIPFVYILQLRSGTLYVGCSTDYEARLRDHENGHACRTTCLDTPHALVWIEIQSDFPQARARETQIKKWSRAKKAALISGDMGHLRRLSRSND
jgi:predicted GIY-YIG superfamily endonuclease